MNRLLIGAVAAVICVAMLAPAWACNVPVYEYALANWLRDDYVAYYLHDGEEDAADAEANALLTRIARREEGDVNLRFSVLDASANQEDLPMDAQYVLRVFGEKSRPRHIVLSPKGRAVFSGKLTVKDLRALVDSKKMAALAKMLSEGKRGALVLLTDKDKEANENALGIVRAVVEMARDAEADIGMLDVSRQDPEEQWLVRQLLAVEPDLKDLAGPMLFGAYGRCHVTEAFLGKGINHPNVLDIVNFMNGPCTCEVKGANMGVDLISNLNWAQVVPDGVAPPRPMEPAGFVTFDEE